MKPHSSDDILAWIMGVIVILVLVLTYDLACKGVSAARQGVALQGAWAWTKKAASNVMWGLLISAIFLVVLAVLVFIPLTIGRPIAALLSGHAAT